MKTSTSITSRGSSVFASSVACPYESRPIFYGTKSVRSRVAAGILDKSQVFAAAQVVTGSRGTQGTSDFSLSCAGEKDCDGFGPHRALGHRSDLQVKIALSWEECNRVVSPTGFVVGCGLMMRPWNVAKL